MKTTTNSKAASDYSANLTPEQVVQHAIGRIFAMGSRPTRPGDVEEYERCRAIIMAGGVVAE